MQASRFIVYLLPLGFQQQTIRQRLPHPHTRAGGAGPAPYSISKLPCLHLSIHAATHTIVRTKIKDPIAIGIMQSRWLSGTLEDLFRGAEVAGLGWSNQNIEDFLLLTLARCTPGHQTPNIAMELFARPARQVSGWGVHWAGHAGHLLPSSQTGKFQNILPTAPSAPPDVTGLAEVVCLVCMPGFRAGCALGEPGQPSVNFTGKKPNLGAHAP
eukprot:1157437-Pelagomonas_calceolata.AAC.8